MGAEPYEYYVAYQSDVQAALEVLRTQVFERGEFNGAEFGPATPQDALEMNEEAGTASILDIQRVAEQPGFFCAAPFSSKELEDYFGTAQPTRDDIEQADHFWDDLQRGQARYIVVYDQEQPTELYFAGYSFD